MLDEVIADLRAATGAQHFDLHLVATVDAPPLVEPLLPAPTPPGDHRADARGRRAHRFAGGTDIAARGRRRGDRPRRRVSAGDLGGGNQGDGDVGDCTRARNRSCVSTSGDADDRPGRRARAGGGCPRRPAACSPGSRPATRRLAATVLTRSIRSSRPSRSGSTPRGVFAWSAIAGRCVSRSCAPIATP